MNIVQRLTGSTKSSTEKTPLLSREERFSFSMGVSPTGIMILQLGNGSWLQFQSNMRVTLAKEIITLGGDAMLDLGERGYGDWTGFKDLTLRFVHLQGFGIVIPDWWYQIPKDLKKSTLGITYSYPNRHRRFLEGLYIPISKEGWEYLQDCLFR